MVKSFQVALRCLFKTAAIRVFKSRANDYWDDGVFPRQLLFTCISNLCSGNVTPHVALTLKAMFTLAFFSFLRC